MWPDRQMLFYFLIPIKMKYFVADHRSHRLSQFL